MVARNMLTGLMALAMLACAPGGIGAEVGDLTESDGTGLDEAGDSTDVTGQDTTDGAMPDLGSDPTSAEYLPGELWGPCPIDESAGTITLCNYENVMACVVSENGNMCLPIGSCPTFPNWPDFSDYLSMGWGYACYPRCDADDDCAEGMICDKSLIYLEAMCSWPVG